jgi:hypothetical protein
MTAKPLPTKPGSDDKPTPSTELQDLRKRLLNMIVSKEAAQKGKPR